MSLAELIRRMAEAGAPSEAIAIAVEAIEAIQSASEVVENRREADRQRQRRFRLKQRDNNVTSRDSNVTPPLQKERVPPTPPLLEKTNPPLPIADAMGVDVTVDGPSAVEKSKKNLDQLRDFGGSWNQLAGELRLPMIDEIKPGSPRERQALARLREMPETGIGGLMARIRGSPFLCGSSGFVASFDWVIKPSNFQKIMEGNYEDRKVTEISKWRR